MYVYTCKHVPLVCFMFAFLPGLPTPNLRKKNPLSLHPLTYPGYKSITDHLLREPNNASISGGPLESLHGSLLNYFKEVPLLGVRERKRPPTIKN